MGIERNMRKDITFLRRPVMYKLTCTHPDTKNVVGQPSPLVYYVLHAHIDRSQYPAEFRDTPGPIAKGRVEFHQSPVDGQPSIQASAQH
jgi:hypothetical protein